MSQRSIIPESFIWSQTDSEVVLLITEKFLQFCWHASGLDGMCYLELLCDLQFYAHRTRIDLLFYRFFTIPMTIVLEQPTMDLETQGEYNPGIGITMKMIKETPGLVWKSFQVNSEKEFYVKQYKALDKKALVNSYPNVIFAKTEMNIQECASYEKWNQDQLNLFYENCFEFLRNGAKLKHLLKLNTKLNSTNPFLIAIKNKFQDQSLEMAKMLFGDNLLKFQQPKFLSDLVFGVNERSFIVVKASIDSSFSGIQDLVINDAFENGVKCGIWNIETKDYIKKGTWMIIKEPYLSFAIHHLPSITISKVQDIIFLSDQNVFEKEPLTFPHNVNAETRRNIQEIYREQVATIVFEHELKGDLRIILMSFEWNSSKLSKEHNTLFIEQEGDWIGAVIKEETQIGENCYQISFVNSVKSELFIESLKRLLEKTPGRSILFWRPGDFKLASVAQFLLHKAGISFKGMEYFYQNSLEIKNIDEALSFWKLQREIIFQEVGSLEKRKGKDNMKKDEQLRDKHMMRIHQQIQKISEIYGLLKKKVDIQQYSSKAISQNFDKDNSIEKSKSIDVFNSRKIANDLHYYGDQEIAENAIFYLLEYGKTNKNGSPKTKQEFSEFVVLNKISKTNIEFKLENALKSLDLVELPVPTDVVFKLQRNEEISLIEKIKNQKSEINNMLVEGEGDEELLICQDDQDLQSILGEFDEGESIRDVESRIGELLMEKEDSDDEEGRADLGTIHSKDFTPKQTKQEDLLENLLKQESRNQIQGKNQQKREQNNSEMYHDIIVQAETDKKEILKKVNEVNQRKNKQNEQNSQLPQSRSIEKKQTRIPQNMSNPSGRWVPKSQLEEATNQNEKKQTSTYQKKSNSGWKWVPLKESEEAKKQLEDAENEKNTQKASQTIPKPQKHNISSQQSDSFSSYSIRSKESHQQLNEHWKSKLADRFGVDASNEPIKKMVLNEVKQTLNNPNSTLKQSLKQPDRFLLCNPLTRMHFVLKKTYSAKTNKTSYVPITVLTKDMKFI